MGIASLGRRDWDFDTEQSAAFGEEMRLRTEKLKEEKTMSGVADAAMNVITDLSTKLVKAQDRSDATDLVLLCAQDIVNAWPDLSIRTLGEMNKRVETLRQALEAAKK